MQLEISPVESAINEANVPVPLLIGTHGWGLFVETRRPGVFAVATEADDLVKATFGLGPAHADGLRFPLVSTPSSRWGSCVATMT
jgi:alpha-D-xyloside xylohydrolase